MRYKIELSKRSYKYLEKLDKNSKKRISDHLLLLTENPRNPELDIKKIQGESSSIDFVLVTIESFIRLKIMYLLLM